MELFYQMPVIHFKVGVLISGADEETQPTWFNLRSSRQLFRRHCLECIESVFDLGQAHNLKTGSTSQLMNRLRTALLSPYMVHSARGKQEEGIQGCVRLSDLHVPSPHGISRTAVLCHRRGTPGGEAPIGVLDQTWSCHVAVYRRLEQLAIFSRVFFLRDNYCTAA